MKQLHRTAKVISIRRTILIVDDELKILELLDRFLSISGYTVFRATDADTAMKIYQKERIDAVLLDINLPSISGGELFTKIKMLNPAVKVVISSGYVNFDLEAQMLAAGARCMIHKPYSLEELGQALQEACES